jgi:hypothetical protein
MSDKVDVLIFFEDLKGGGMSNFAGAKEEDFFFG